MIALFDNEEVATQLSFANNELFFFLMGILYVYVHFSFIALISKLFASYIVKYLLLF